MELHVIAHEVQHDVQQVQVVRGVSADSINDMRVRVRCRDGDTCDQV